MKKLISVLLCAALIFGASINLSLNSMRPQAADGGAAEFAENVGEMLRDFGRAVRYRRGRALARLRSRKNEAYSQGGRRA